MKIRFISLASGSSGNCYYLGTETYGILIDAGIPSRTIRKTLKDFASEIEREVHKDYPDVRIGLCANSASYLMEGVDILELCKIIAGAAIGCPLPQQKMRKRTSN